MTLRHNVWHGHPEGPLPPLRLSVWHPGVWGCGQRMGPTTPCPQWAAGSRAVTKAFSLFSSSVSLIFSRFTFPSAAPLLTVVNVQSHLRPGGGQTSISCSQYPEAQQAFCCFFVVVGIDLLFILKGISWIATLHLLLELHTGVRTLYFLVTYFLSSGIPVFLRHLEHCCFFFKRFCWLEFISIVSQCDVEWCDEITTV